MVSPTVIEESFFTLKAVAGSSCISMTSVALTTEARSGRPPQAAAAAFTSSSFPTRTISRSLLALAAWRAPLTISPGALSPPMASTMIFIFCSLLPPTGRDLLFV